VQRIKNVKRPFMDITVAALLAIIKKQKRNHKKYADLPYFSVTNNKGNAGQYFQGG